MIKRGNIEVLEYIEKSLVKMQRGKVQYLRGRAVCCIFVLLSGQQRRPGITEYKKEGGGMVGTSLICLIMEESMP